LQASSQSHSLWFFSFFPLCGIRLSQFAPLVPMVSNLEADEEQVLEELDQTLEVQLQLNQHLQQQQETVDRVLLGSQNITAQLEDAMRENAEIERLRGQQSKMTGMAVGAVTGGVTGVLAGPAAIVTAPAGAGVGALAGYGIGSLFTRATHAAVDREISRYDQRHHAPPAGTGTEEQEDGDGDGWGQSAKTSRRGKDKEKRREETTSEGTTPGQSTTPRHHTLSKDGTVVVTMRCWENERHAARAWDHGNLTTGERGRWSVEDCDSPAVIHPEPMFEPEVDVEWLDDWVAEDVLDPQTGTPRPYRSVGREDGWHYAHDWNGPWVPSVRWNSYVRRRRWLRLGVVSPPKAERRSPSPPGAFGRSAMRPLSPPSSSSHASDREALLGSASASASVPRGVDPNELVLQRLAHVKQALGDGGRLLYVQGEQLRQAAAETVQQDDILDTTARVQGKSAFYNVVLGYLNPKTWFAESPVDKKKAVEGKEKSGLATFDGDHWEFEGREPTLGEQMQMDAFLLSQVTHMISRELDLQGGTMDTIGTNQDKNAAKMKKLAAKVEKQL